MANPEKTVLCIKWGTLFSADYVNVLFNACRKAISCDFRFVCLTDDSTGFQDGIEAFPIPDIGLSKQEWYTPGVWPKIALFVSTLHNISGRCLFIDLDMIVLGGLDEMLEHPAPFIGLGVGPGWRPGHEKTGHRHLGTGVMAFNAGEQSQIVSGFCDDKEGAMARYQNEQDFVGDHVQSLEFWPDSWVLSFKRHLRRNPGVDLVLSPKKPPLDAKIIAFHGDPRPINLIGPKVGFWDKFPHMGHGQVVWIYDYWVENGGRVPPFE